MSVYKKLEKWGITNYTVIDKQAIEEITLGASILATGGGVTRVLVYFGH